MGEKGTATGRRGGREGAANEQWDPLKFLTHLVDGEVVLRRERSTQRRIRLARFPVLKTLDQFHWAWPKKINRLQIQNVFRLDFIDHKANVIFLGGVDLVT